MCSLVNKQLLLTAYAYLFITGQQGAQQGSDALQTETTQVEQNREATPGEKRRERMRQSVIKEQLAPLAEKSREGLTSEQILKDYPNLRGDYYGVKFVIRLEEFLAKHSTLFVAKDAVKIRQQFDKFDDDNGQVGGQREIMLAKYIKLALRFQQATAEGEKEMVVSEMQELLPPPVLAPSEYDIHNPVAGKARQASFSETTFQRQQNPQMQAHLKKEDLKRMGEEAKIAAATENANGFFGKMNDVRTNSSAPWQEGEFAKAALDALQSEKAREEALKSDEAREKGRRFSFGQQQPPANVMLQNVPTPGNGGSSMNLLAALAEHKYCE